ncbi:hypothetical protein OURE66S_01246 [Oligella ureolytica]
MFGNQNKKGQLHGGISDDLKPDLSHEINDSSVERGQVSPSEVKKKSSVKTVFTTIGFVFGLLVFVVSIISLFTGKSDVDKEVVEMSTTDSNEIRNRRPQQLELVPSDPPAPPSAVSNSVVQSPTANEVSLVETSPQPVVIGATTTPTPPEPNRKLTGSVLVDFTPRREVSVKEDVVVPELPAVVPARKAAKRVDRTYLLKKGTNISCTLNTKIITTHPGITRCITSKDVYSADGKVLLLERGSEIIGEQTTSMIQGQARVYVMWTQVETPHGVMLDIDSPGADSLGASGHAAQVDNHFWKRFGGAIMLSMIDDVMAIASDRASDSQYRFDETSDAVEDMAAVALENTINIPPTGYVNQGTLVNVMVARDVDFSGVYELVNPYLLY